LELGAWDLFGIWLIGFWNFGLLKAWFTKLFQRGLSDTPLDRGFFLSRMAIVLYAKHPFGKY